jgi:hypothetical protein
MKLSIEKRETRKGSVVLSLAAHVVAIALIASITFHYPLSALFPNHETKLVERIQYVETRPAAGGAAGGGAKPTAAPRKGKPPAPLVAPVAVPTELPPIASPIAAPGAENGTGTGGGGGGNGVGLATGVAPSLPDPRIELRPNTLRLPLTTAQRNDSAVKAIYLAYRQAEIEAAARTGRSPRDWTIERNGGKYGLDSSYIYLGKFKIPSAILAALPLNTGGVAGYRIIEGRNAAWIQNDIYMHSQGLSEDDFRAAIKRIRERTDRDKQEAAEAKARQRGIVP